MDFKQSETYKNLNKALEGELKASTKYQLFAMKAEDDVYIQIADIFRQTSANEREHAEIWYKILHDGKMTPTIENLRTAASGEQYEWSEMYKSFAATAHNEGFHQIARLFEGVGAIEYSHDRRFKALADNMENGKVFCKDTEKIWICINCGSLYKGKCAPPKCPVCGYPQGYFELICNNY